MLQTKTTGFLSGNTLKLLAAVFMLIDHVGMIFFPQALIFRMIGRLAMPIFAYMVAEGCRYTRSPIRYLLGLGICLIICQIVLFIGSADTDLCILATFCLGALVTFCLQRLKAALFDGSFFFKKLFWGVGFLVLTLGIRSLCRYVYMAYGFWGCMLPVFASLFHMPDSAPRFLRRLDSKWLHIATFTVGLLLLCRNSVWIQYYSLFSLPFLLCYNGTRGKAKIKYFFYIFYPVHLALLYGLFWLITL